MSNKGIVFILLLSLILTLIILSINSIWYKIVFYKTFREINKIPKENLLLKVGSDYLSYEIPPKRRGLILLSDYCICELKGDEKGE